jgi:hypothetical protein
VPARHHEKLPEQLVVVDVKRRALRRLVTREKGLGVAGNRNLFCVCVVSAINTSVDWLVHTNET